MKKYFITVLMLAFTANIYAQMAGNQVYQNDKSYNSPNTSIHSTDSTLTIKATVLLNKKADYYLATVGIKQEAKSVTDCNQALNQRINAFMKDIKKLGIQDNDAYIDFISQTKVYDHKIEGNTITEFLDGFEIRKNIIFKFKDLELMDKIIELASKQEIYDIVKVEYFNEDTEKIYAQLFDESIKIIENKKARFLKVSNIKLSGKHRIMQDMFQVYYPKDSYKEYSEAFESSSVNTNYSKEYIKKQVRKDKTFYYEGAQSSPQIDKNIDNVSPIIGIQYVLSLRILYELE